MHQLIKPKSRKAQFTSLLIHLEARIEINLEDISKGLLKNPLILARIVANLAIVRNEGFYFYLLSAGFEPWVKPLKVKTLLKAKGSFLLMAGNERKHLKEKPF